MSRLTKPFILGVLFGIAPHLGLTKPLHQTQAFHRLVALFQQHHGAVQQAATVGCDAPASATGIGACTATPSVVKH